MPMSWKSKPQNCLTWEHILAGGLVKPEQEGQQAYKEVLKEQVASTHRDLEERSRCTWLQGGSGCGSSSVGAASEH